MTITVIADTVNPGLYAIADSRYAIWRIVGNEHFFYHFWTFLCLKL